MHAGVNGRSQNGPVTESFYDDPQAFAAYARHRRGGVSSPNQVMEEPALWRHLGPVGGHRVADLGCGDASIGLALLDAGSVSYYGADASVAMVAAAQSTLRGRAAEIEHAGIEDFRFPPDSFDLIISRLALHYVVDIESVLGACAECLTPGGRLVFTVVHPVITSHDGNANPGTARTSWLVDDYFSPGPRRRPWLGGTVTWQHRTIEDYVSAVVRAGLMVEALSECPPDRALFEGDEDEFARRLRTPLFLLLAARAPG
jgi:SAM-dependent methyltransferase